MYLVEDEESEVKREDILDDEMESQTNNLYFQERLDSYVEQSRKELPLASNDPAPVEQDLIKQEFLCFERSKGKDRPKYLQAFVSVLNRNSSNICGKREKFQFNWSFCHQDS